MDELNWAVKEKEQLVAKLQEKERVMNSNFLEAIGELKFKEYLVKVFKKKVKRVKPRNFSETGISTLLQFG